MCASACFRTEPALYYFSGLDWLMERRVFNPVSNIYSLFLASQVIYCTCALTENRLTWNPYEHDPLMLRSGAENQRTSEASCLGRAVLPSNGLMSELLSNGGDDTAYIND